MAKRRSSKLGNNRKKGRVHKTAKRLAAKKRMLEIKAMKPAERKKALAEERAKK